MRNLKCFTRRTHKQRMPGLLKIGLTTVDAAHRAQSVSESTGVPAQFEVLHAEDFPQAISRKDLYSLEQKAHRMLADCRYSENREFFRCSLERTRMVLKQVQKDARENLSVGLTPLGKPQQSHLSDMPKPQSRRPRPIREKPPIHWHVWIECGRDEQQVTALELYPRTYWSKSGARGRVKRDKKTGTHSECLVCQDTACPDFGQRRNGTQSHKPQRRERNQED